MQPPRDPPAAVDALVADSGRRATRWQCPSPRAPLAAPIVSRFVGSIFASLWHAKGTVPASQRHEPDERTLCGRLLGTPCIVGRDPDAQEKSRARFVRAENCRARSGHRERFRAGIGRSGASECPNVARQRLGCPNIARESQRPKVAEQHPLKLGAHRMNTAAKTPTPATRTSPP